MAEAVYTYDQLSAWYGQHGGRETGRRSVNVDVPNPNYDGLTDKRTTIPSQAYEITAADGSTIVVQEIPAADGSAQPSYTVHSHQDAKPTGAAATPNQTAADEAKAAEDKREREYNQANGNGYKTHKEVDDDKKKAATEQEAAATRQRAEEDRQKAADAKAKADAEAAKPKPPPTQPNPADPTRQQRWDPAANDGAGGWVDNGPIAKTPTLGTVGHDEGGDYTITLGPDGQPVKTYATEVGGDGKPTNPAYVGSMPTYIPKEIADDLTNYSKELNDAVNAKAITPARATALMDARIKAADAAVKAEIDKAKTVYGGEVTQRGQDAQSTQGRLNESGANYRQALTTAQGVNDWVNPGSDAGYRLFKALLEEGRNQAQLYGGLDQQPSVVPGAALKPTGITVQSPDGTVVTIPSTPQPPDPGMTPEQLQQSVQRPEVVQPEPVGVASANPQMAQMLEMGQPTGVAAIDAAGQRMTAQRQRPRMTFDRMEQRFRDLGMDEDAIGESRSHWMGAGVA